MSNKITIIFDDIKQLPDNSITDSETIRQIALWSIANQSDELTCKIQTGHEYKGLYPHIQKPLMIVPEGFTLDVDKLKSQRKSAHSNNDKYEIMLELIQAHGSHQIGHQEKLINSIFDPKVGIAFLPIDKCWKILWTRQFTGYFDKEQVELYDGDYLQDEETSIIYEIVWHTHTCSWDLNQVTFPNVNKNDFLEMISFRQSLGSNGYLRRNDLLKIGNKYENSNLINND